MKEIERVNILEKVLRIGGWHTAKNLRKRLGYGGAEDTRFNSDMRCLRNDLLESDKEKIIMKGAARNFAYKLILNTQ